MFNKINFRYTDAQDEIYYSPELIKDAYVDIENILENIIRPEKYIVLGPKGAGKSALSSKLQLISKERWDMFVSSEDLEQFDFNLLSKSATDKTTSLNDIINTWQLLLLIRLIPLFFTDEVISDNNHQLYKLNDGLKNIGLIQSDKLTNIVEFTSGKRVFSKFKIITNEIGFESNNIKKNDIKRPSEILDAIKYVLQNIKGTNNKKYYLILDGIDYAVKKGKETIGFIDDLLTAVRQINRFFLDFKINAKIIILLRDEIISLISNPNLAKRINDNGIQFKWYDNPREPFKTNLLKVIEKRALLVGFQGTIEELWKQWFDKSVLNYNHHSLSFILDNTRYLPRDLITFFRELQKLNTSPPFSRNTMLAALANYSDWFLAELNDSIVGIIDNDIRENLNNIFSSLGKEFYKKDFEKELNYFCPNCQMPIDTILRELFNTSWIGNIMVTQDNKKKFAWKYRKKNETFKPNFKICLHKGLYKTLNLV